MGDIYFLTVGVSEAADVAIDVDTGRMDIDKVNNCD